MKPSDFGDLMNFPLASPWHDLLSFLKKIPQLLDSLPGSCSAVKWNKSTLLHGPKHTFVQTFMVPRRWIPMSFLTYPLTNRTTLQLHWIVVASVKSTINVITSHRWNITSVKFLSCILCFLLSKSVTMPTSKHSAVPASCQHCHCEHGNMLMLGYSSAN